MVCGLWRVVWALGILTTTVASAIVFCSVFDKELQKEPEAYG